jgi:hypothetical protein
MQVMQPFSDVMNHLQSFMVAPSLLDNVVRIQECTVPEVCRSHKTNKNVSVVNACPFCLEKGKPIRFFA